jgi:hypothetical protein
VSLPFSCSSYLRSYFLRIFLNRAKVNSSLAPIDVGLASPALVAFTSSGAYYYTITCIITEQLPKLFLASNVTSGIEELMNPALQDTLTGGSVEECGLLPRTI